jgi:hypothetical protein
MKKKHFSVLIMVVFAFSFVWVPQAISSSPCCPPPPPPPPCEPTDCSPGFWKNHTEVWFGEGCGGLIDDAELLLMLNARGPGSRDVREEAQSYLNNCGFSPSPCEDD